MPNGGIRTPREAMFLKMTGLTPGVPDVFIMYPFGGYHGLVIEFKRQGGTASPEQKEWLNNLSHLGYMCALCKSFEQGRDVVNNYFNQPNNKFSTFSFERISIEQSSIAG